jgi:hypothetical protein
VKLSDAQRRHLIELLDAPYWHPANAGEWACAQALERKGLLNHHVARGQKPYELNAEGRRVALAASNQERRG